MGFSAVSQATIAAVLVKLLTLYQEVFIGGVLSIQQRLLGKIHGKGYELELPFYGEIVNSLCYLLSTKNSFVVLPPWNVPLID